MFNPGSSPWWAPSSPGPIIPAPPSQVSLAAIAVILGAMLKQGDTLAAEMDAWKAQTRPVLLAAINLLEKMDKPAIDPADIAAVTLDLKTVTDALANLVTAQTPPVTGA